MWDVLADEKWDTFVAVPMMVRGRVIGVLNGFHQTRRIPDDEELRFLTAMADQAAVAVDNARLYRELQLRAAQEERERLARDMHDSVQQALFSLSLQARSIELSANPSLPQELVRDLIQLRELAQSALTEMQDLIQHRRPAKLRELGLAEGLRKHVAELSGSSGLQIDIVCDEDPMLEADLEDDLFRLAQEALNNVIKHARARRVSVELRSDDHDPTALLLEIRDDGVGLTSSATGRAYFGMATMLDRASRHGARLVMGPGNDGVGTSVRVMVPGVLPAVER
jgi:signal transduction histidine kinase